MPEFLFFTWQSKRIVSYVPCSFSARICLLSLFKQIPLSNVTNKRQAEAYVNMDVGTTMHNAYVQSAMSRNVDYGNDLVYPGIKRVSRPLCYPWQDKVLSTTNRSGVVTDLNDSPIQVYLIDSTSYGEPAGIWGINCGHSCNVFIPGLSIIRGEVPDKEKNDELYALTQEQRRLEREVRYAKRNAAMADATGDKEAFDAAALRVKRKQADLSAFLKENDLNASVYRSQVVGYNRSVSNAVTASANRQEQERQAQERERQIIAEIKATGIKGRIELHPVIPDVKNLGFDDEHINVERNHNVTREQAETFIKNAKILVTRSNGASQNYYSYEGAAYVNTERMTIATAFSVAEYDEKTRSMMEVLKKHGI